MNIWLDVALLARHSMNKYDGLCPSDNCPNDTCANDTSLPAAVAKSAEAPDVLFTSPVLEENIRDLYTHTFVCAERLHIQKCGERHWLVCHTGGAGIVAVLDDESYELLQSFRAMRRLQDVVESSAMPSASIARATQLFTKAGLLRDLDQPVPAYTQEQAQVLAAWLHVTNACNLRCHYCYVSKSTEHMTDDIAKRAVDALIRSAIRYKHRGIHITYAGGEATLRLPYVLDTHDYALQQTQEHGLSFSASLISNGVAIPWRAIEQLKQRQIGIGLSLDGIGDSHDRQRSFINGKGSFTFVDRTITRLLAGGLAPSINVTVTQNNLDDLPGLLEYILQRDLPFGLSYYRDNECSTHLSDLQFTDAHMISGMRNAFAYIEQHLPRRPLLGLLVDKASTRAPHQYKCGVGRNYLAINQQGGIARCQMDITDVVTSVDADNPLQAIREHRQGVQAVAIDDKEGCRTCEWRYWCSGGCPMLTYRLTGRSDIRSPNCAIYKALFPEALRLEALRLLKYESPIVL
jgi:uncharacterized protein